MKKRKIVSLLLAASLFAALLPAHALAADAKTVKTEAELRSAVEDASGATTIKLGENIYLEATLRVEAGQDITLDLNGHAITVYKNEGTGRSLYAVDNYGTFTLMDSVGTGSITARGVENLGQGVMVINGGKIVSCDANGGAAVWNEANLTINGGTFETVHVGSPSDSVGVGCVNNSGKALITGGTFYDVNRRTYAIISNNEIEITPQSEGAVKVFGAHGALAVDAGTAVVNGGSYDSSDFYGLYVSNDGVGTDPQQAAVTVNGGTFSGKSYSVWVGSDYNNPVNSTIAIKGGSFEKPLNSQNNAREGAIAVSGGEFLQPVSEEHLVDGISVASLQKADTAKYYIGTAETLGEQLAAKAEQGDTLKVLQGDADLSQVVSGVDVSNEGDGTVTINDTTLSKGENVVSHTHVFDQHVVTDAYKSADATCTEAAKYYYSCECGKAGTETFTVGEAKGHQYQDGKCTVCGAADPNAPQVTPQPDIPKTGENSHAIALFVLGLTAVAGAWFTMRRRAEQH